MRKLVVGMVMVVAVVMVPGVAVCEDFNIFLDNSIKKIKSIEKKLEDYSRSKQTNNTYKSGNNLFCACIEHFRNILGNSYVLSGEIENENRNIHERIYAAHMYNILMSNYYPAMLKINIKNAVTLLNLEHDLSYLYTVITLLDEYMGKNKIFYERIRPLSEKYTEKLFSK